MKLFSDLLNKIKGYSVFALVGESGTGKSYRAKIIATENGLEAIIDDGLLIKDDKILAGHSAKKEKTYLGAVRVALFDDKDHRDQIAKVLDKEKIKKILILGTSEKMVKKIALRLQLPEPSKIIRIEDIAPPHEIEMAKRSRMVEGKHVIPIPAIEVKTKYPQIFSNALRVFLGNREQNSSVNSGAQKFEKTVVRPEFSKKGRVSISEAALSQMVKQHILEFDENIKIRKLSIKSSKRGYKFVITIDVPFRTQLSGEINKLQKDIITNIESCTGILVEEVNIIIDKISQAVKPQKSSE